MIVGILDFQMSGGGHPGAIIFIHHEAANASIVEALFPQQWTHHEGVNDDMMFWTEMDNDLRGCRRIIWHDPADNPRTCALVDPEYPRRPVSPLAAPARSARCRRSMFDFVIPYTRDREHYDAPQRESAYPGESDRPRAARIFGDFRSLRFDEKSKIDMLPLGFLTRAFVGGLSDLQKTFREANFELLLFELGDGLSCALGVL